MATPIKKPVYETYVPPAAGAAAEAGSGGGSSAPTPIVRLVREPPVVTPYDDAVVHHSIKGDPFEGIWHGGIFSGMRYQITEENSTVKFIVKAGYGTIFGRQFEIDEDHEILVSALTGKKYCVVYVEVNLASVTANFARIRMAYATAAYPDLETDDLIVKKQGTARMALYRFIYDSSLESDKVHTLSKLAYDYEAGTVQKVRFMASDGKWNGRTLSDLFYYSADRFKKTNHASYADLGKALGPSGNWKAYSDLLEIKSDNEGVPRQLLLVAKDCWYISGTDIKSNINSGARFFVENRTYTFTYSGKSEQYGHLIPPGCQCVGVIIEGYITLFYWSDDDDRWHQAEGNQYFTYQKPRVWSKGYSGIIGLGSSPAIQAFTPHTELHALLAGDLWAGNKKLWIGQVLDLEKKDSLWTHDYQRHGYAVMLTDGSRMPIRPPMSVYNDDNTTRPPNHGNRYFGDHRDDNHDNNQSESYIEFRYNDWWGATDPEIVVHMGDDVCLQADLTFRPIFVKGGGWVPGNFSDFAYINPDLEGGQT